MTASGGANAVGREIRLERLLDKKGSVQLLDVFLTNEEIPVTRPGLERLTGLSQPTVYRRVEDLCEIGIIEKSESDSPRMFRLNTEYEVATGLLEAHTALHAHTDEIQGASEDYDGDDGQFHTGSPFVELFRYPSNVSLLVALLRRPEERLRAAEIARIADVDRGTVGENISILVDIGLATEYNPTYATNPTYKLNTDHPAVSGFQRAIDNIQQQDQLHTVEPQPPEEEDLQTGNDEKRQEVHDRLANTVKEDRDSSDESTPSGTSESSIWDHLKLEIFFNDAALALSESQDSADQKNENEVDGLNAEYRRHHANQFKSTPESVGAAA